MNKILQYSILIFVVVIIFFIFVSFQKKSADEFFKDVTAEVYYSEACGCCVNYIGYLRDSGFNVKPVMVDDVKIVKDELKIPANLRSCHVTKVDKYFVEGHVPVEAVKKLLTEKPDINGIALPGMPSGSPGMPCTKVPFEIYAVKDGKSAGLFVTL